MKWYENEVGTSKDASFGFLVWGKSLPVVCSDEGGPVRAACLNEGRDWGMKYIILMMQRVCWAPALLKNLMSLHKEKECRPEFLQV